MDICCIVLLIAKYPASRLSIILEKKKLFLNFLMNFSCIILFCSLLTIPLITGLTRRDIIDWYLNLVEAELQTEDDLLEKKVGPQYCAFSKSPFHLFIFCTFYLFCVMELLFLEKKLLSGYIH